MNQNLRRSMAVWAVVLGLAMTVPATAQSQADREKAKAQSELSMAESAVASAEAAGAATLARTLYDESQAQLREARADWNGSKSSVREGAILSAVEARYAALAAEAQASLMNANMEIRNLRTDITQFGGTPTTVTLYEPPPTISRGMTSLDRVIVAENALKVAREAGGDQVAATDLKDVEETLKTARRLAKAQKQSGSADHLAYVGEMRARRAEYIARRNAVGPQLGNFRLERTRFAQQAADARARQEASARTAAEQQASELRRQLETVAANRQAEQAELQRLRQQVADHDNELRSRLSADREARVAAERSYDDLMRRYQASLVEGSATSIEAEQLRRQVEDQSLSLRSLQERERLSETSMANQIDTLQKELEHERLDGRMNVDVLTQREQQLTQQRAELQRLQREREENERARTEAENARATAVAELERARTEAQNARATAAVELDRARTEAEVARASAAAELDRARTELARRDTEAQNRINTMQTELSKLAQTRTSERGFVVTLPGLFFDSGKSVLKPGAKNTLTKIATQLQMNPETSIEIEGHTDSVGSEQSNQALSEKRAAAVRDYLAARGVTASRVRINGLGEGTPVASNDTPSGRQQNRRVELVIAPASQVSSQPQ